MKTPNSKRVPVETTVSARVSPAKTPCRRRNGIYVGIDMVTKAEAKICHTDGSQSDGTAAILTHVEEDMQVSLSGAVGRMVI